MKTAAKITFGVLALAGVAGGAWFALKRKPSTAVKANLKGQPPTVSVTVADVLNLPKVDFVPKALDLSHLGNAADWRYHGTVVV